MSRARAVIIGGNGFLGRGVQRALQHRVGDSVDILVAGRTGEDGPGYRAGDRNDRGFLRELVAFAPDLWFDLAVFSPSHMDDLLVEVTKGTSPPRLIVAGTIAECGLHRPLPKPLTESHPLSPAGTYGIDKAAAWHLLASQGTALDACWAVIPQLWGPGDPHGRDAVYTHRLLSGEPILLRGNGRTLMPDGFVDTVAQAMVHLALEGPPGIQRYHVAGPRPMTPLAFLRHATEALELPMRIHHVDPGVAPRDFRPAFGDYDLHLDTTRLQATGFSPSVDMATGVARTVLWHRDHPGPLDSRCLRSVGLGNDMAFCGVERTYRV